MFFEESKLNRIKNQQRYTWFFITGLLVKIKDINILHLNTQMAIEIIDHGHLFTKL